MASSNPFALRPSGADHSYLRFLQRWRDQLWERHLNILSDLCDRNLHMAGVYGDSWFKLDDHQRMAMDDTLRDLYLKEQKNMAAFRAAVEKLTLYLTAT